MLYATYLGRVTPASLINPDTPGIMYRLVERYGCYPDSPEGEIRLYGFFVIRETKCGVWIYDLRDTKRFIRTTSRKQYAYSTKQAALESFIARKTSHLKILNNTKALIEQSLVIANDVRKIIQAV